MFNLLRGNIVSNNISNEWCKKCSTVTLSFTGDNVIDNEEFEYVLSEFGVSEKVARQAFTIFTQVSRHLFVANAKNISGIKIANIILDAHYNMVVGTQIPTPY